MEAEGSADARDKFFMYVLPSWCRLIYEKPHHIELFRVAVPEFGPSTASAAKANAALLNAAMERLGSRLAEMYVAMPSLAACGFKASLAKHSKASAKQALHAAGTNHGQDVSSSVVFAVAPAIGVDMEALQALVSSTRDTLTKVSQ